VSAPYRFPRNSHEPPHRGGAGKGGWGKPGDEASLTPEVTAEGEHDETVLSEPDNEVTLEDYERAKAEKKAALMASLKQKNKVGAAKTVDESAFAGMKLASKHDGVDVMSSFELEGGEAVKGKRVRTKSGGEKKVLDTGFKTTPSTPADDRDTRGGRGGRGSGSRDSGRSVGRGRGAREGARGVVRGAGPGNARGAGFSAKIDDVSAFPILGGK
jgi:plasminogen activator inhibitor 1 RNA-binding protein